MAFRPCSSCGNRFYGATEYTYVTWFRGEDKYAFRLAECSSCVQELRNRVSEQADRKTDEGWEFARYDLELVVPAQPDLAARKAAAS